MSRSTCTSIIMRFAIWSAGRSMTGTIFRKDPHQGVRRGAGRKSREVAQIAKNRNNLAPLSFQHQLFGLLNDFRHLWRQESLQALDAFGFLLGNGQFARHLVEAIRQLLELVAARDRDAMVEMAGADSLSPVLE